jgi:hypothetical protein
MPEVQTGELTPNPDYYLISASGLLGESPRSTIEDVPRILQKAANEAPANGLVIHFHGGLVDRQSGLNGVVAPLTNRYAEAQAYPLFFVWESGFLEALRNNKTELLKDPAFRELVKKVSEWAIEKIAPGGNIVFRGAGGEQVEDIRRFRKEFDAFFDEQIADPPCESARVPRAGDPQVQTKASSINVNALAQEIAARLDNDPAFKQALSEAFNASIPPSDLVTKGAGNLAASTNLLLDQRALDEMFPPAGGVQATSNTRIKTRGVFDWLGVAKYVAKLVIAVVRRYGNAQDHGLYCTIVEEVLRSAYGNLIGATVWNQMKNDTLDSFGDRGEACGSAVIKELRRLEEAGKGFTKITLIGHSTGAIYICNFLDAAAKAGLTSPMRVVFLAPAVTAERFAKAINAHEGAGLARFRTFGMTDERESADRMLSPLYTRSLLYFVSGLLEGRGSDGAWESVIDMPLVGMQRFYVRTSPSDTSDAGRVRRFLDAVPNRAVWSRSADQEDGLNSDSQKHGDFDNDDSTLRSVVAFIKH